MNFPGLEPADNEADEPITRTNTPILCSLIWIVIAFRLFHVDSEMMEQSLAELRTTVDDLEKRMEGLDEESMIL